MKKTKKTRTNNKTNIILVLLIICFIIITSYIVYDEFQTKEVNNEANEFVQEFEEQVIDENNEENIVNENNIEETKTSNTGSNKKSNGTRKRSNNKSYKYSMNTYKGYNVDGIIKLRSVRLTYPVLAKTNDAKALEKSVVIQYGVGLNEVGNTVIMGHNYRSGKFFGSNKRIKNGDTITITDNKNLKTIDYIVYKKFETTEEDTRYYDRDTNGKKEITLVTCQANNKYRLVIQAKEK